MLRLDTKTPVFFKCPKEKKNTAYALTVLLMKIPEWLEWFACIFLTWVVDTVSQGFWRENVQKRNIENTEKAGNFCLFSLYLKKSWNESRANRNFKNISTVQFFWKKNVFELLIKHLINLYMYQPKIKLQYFHG